MKLTAEAFIKSDLETVWRYTQSPELHVRWDLRFTDIEMLSGDNGKAKRFRYATRIGFGLAIEGWGETIGDGAASALKFGSDDAKSLIEEGAGSWSYQPIDGGLRFSTVYDYSVRYGLLGKVIDSLVFRPLMIWATQWSFDRLRIWIETGMPPEDALTIWLAKVTMRISLALVWIYEGLIPKLLYVHPNEVALVARSGFYIVDPRLMLNGVGVVEVLFGLWLLTGWSEQLSAKFSALGICILGGLVAILQPERLYDPMGGLSKNLGLLACSVAICLLASITPSAQQNRSVKHD